MSRRTRTRLTRLLGIALIAGGALGCSSPVPVPTLPAPAVAPASPASTSPAATAPAAVTIPAIGAASSLVAIGLNPDDTLAVPPTSTPGQAAWFSGSPEPGTIGAAILVGHVNGGGMDGVFARLDELVAGDAIRVDRAGAAPVEFVVERVERHGKDAFPRAAVYGDVDRPELRLITCGGVFDRAAGSYEDNVIVWAAAR